MLADEYTVHLDAFHGPLDLLLFLIRRTEVDISEISLAEVTDQYLSYLGRIEQVDVGAAGEFLVTAATLIELKSRLIVPVDPDDAEAGGVGALLGADERDGPGAAAELVRQLLQFKRCREAAARLEERKLVWDSRFPLRAVATPSGPLPDQGDTSELEDVRLYDLVEAFGHIVETVQFDRLGEHTIGSSDTPIELHAADILERLRGEAEASTGPSAASIVLRSLFADRSRLDVVGLFLAVLELVRQRVIRVETEPESREVRIRMVSEEEEAVHTREPSASDRRGAGAPTAWDDDDVMEDEGEIGPEQTPHPRP